MERIRVLIAYESRLACQLVRAIVSSYADFEVLGEIQEQPQILSAVERNQADFLIVEQEQAGKRPQICDEVWRKSPRTKVLAVAKGNGESTLYWASTEILSARVETSEVGMLNALRGQVEEC